MIYLDNGATSFPKPESVYSRVDEVLRTVGGNPGRASHRMALEADRVVFGARESLAFLLNINDAERLVFTKNATEGINIALKGLIKPGDHIITTSFEHNSVARPIKRLEEEGVSVTRISGTDGLISLEEVKAAIKAETKLVCITHASNVFGAIQPARDIAKLCKDKGVLFMLDASQTAGALPLDLSTLGADIVAGTGHKALFGPQGTGFLYLAEGIEPLPLLDGGTGEIVDILPLPERLEAGTMNMPGLAGLGAGVDFLLETGIDKVRAHEVTLTVMLLDDLAAIEGLTIIGPTEPELKVPLVSFTLAGKEPREIGLSLDNDYDIMVRTGTHCAPEAHKTAGTFPNGTVRVSAGFFNTKEDIERLLFAVREIAAC